MNNLNAKQLTDYKEKGYVAPIDVLSSEETKEIKKEIEYIEKKMARRTSWTRKE